ncbi:MAG: PKD domain-containing protein, partial [Vicingaceae bacterium]
DTITIVVDSFPSQTTLGLDKTICQGASIGLTSNTNPNSYVWSTNDTTAQITINTAGQYWLESSNNNGCVNNDTINITLNGIAPTVGFSTQKLCLNEPVQFTDTSSTTDGSNIIDWSWSFGDAAISSLSSPQHQYNNDSTFIVIFTILTDSNCENTATQTITIHQKPLAGFFTTTTPICSGQPTSFADNSFSTDGAITSWWWDFGAVGNADTSSLENPNYNFPVTANYNVAHIVTTAFNCSDTINQVVTVKASPVSLFTSANHCLTNETAFTNTSQGNVISSWWHFGDAGTSLQEHPKHTYAVAAPYNVTLATTALNGCVDTAIFPITIHENPEAHFVTNDICVQDSVQFFDSSVVAVGSIVDWDWNILNHPNQSANQNPYFLFSDTGYYYIELKVTSSVGCKDSIIDSVFVAPLPQPLFTFTPDVGAPPLIVNFNNLTQGTNTYYWDFGDGNNSLDTSPTYTYLDSNAYTINLIATNSIGCVDSISKLVRVYDPILDIAVTNLSYEINTNYLVVKVRLTNYGSYELNNFDLVSEISGGNAVLETWEGNLVPATNEIYTLKSAFEMNNNEFPDVICVTAQHPNGGVDAVMENNEFCLSLAKFTLISMYPNPASSTLNVHYILPSKGEVSIQLHDVLGKKIADLGAEQAQKGFNRNVINLLPYKKGIYFVEILFNENSIKEKIIIK